MEDKQQSLLLLSTLLYRFGSIFLRACDYQLPQAALLFWLSRAQRKGQWIELFSPDDTLHTCMTDVFSPPQLRSACSALVDKGFLARFYVNDNGSFTYRDSDADLVAEIAPQYLSYFWAHPWPTLFVCVRPLSILRTIEPALDVLISTSVQFRMQHAPYDVGAVIDDVMLMVGGHLTQWGIYPPSRSPLLEQTLYHSVAQTVAKQTEYGATYTEQETQAQ